MMDLLQTCARPMVLPIVFALLAGGFAYLLSRWPAASKILALVAGVVAINCGVHIVRGAEPFAWTWIVLSDTIRLDVDLSWTVLGMVVFFGAAAFELLVVIFSFRAMSGHSCEGKYYAYVTLSLAGAMIVGLAGNLLVLLIGWELVTLMLFLLINQGGKAAGAGAAKTYGILGFADACLLLAVAILMALPGGYKNLLLTSPAVSVASMGPMPMGYVVYVLILIAALAKAGAVPVHSWIPSAAPDAPTPVMAYLPAALDKLMGIYLLAVLALQMFQPDRTMQVVMMVVGGVTIIAAVLMAMMQHNLKRLLAFHAVSQVGYMVLGIGTGTPIGVIGGLFHMLNNAMYKSNLFLMSHTVGKACGSDEIDRMGGLAKLLPVTFVCGLISAAAISGVPPFNGFASKWLVYQGTLEVASNGLVASPGLSSALLVVAVFGSALTLASFVKVIYSAFLAPGPARTTEQQKSIRESYWLAAPMVVLAAGCVVLGLWPQLAIKYILEPEVARVALSGSALSSGGVDLATGIGIWNPTQVTGLLIIGILLGLAWVWLVSRSPRARVVRPFLGGEVPATVPAPRKVVDTPGHPDRFRIPGTHFYETVSKLPGVGPLLKNGQEGALDAYHWSGKHGKTFVEWLRSLHTGLINLYVAWVLIGLIVTLAYLLLTMGR